jgi:hypothetical protein
MSFWPEFSSYFLADIVRIGKKFSELRMEIEINLNLIPQVRFLLVQFPFNFCSNLVQFGIRSDFWQT